MQLNSLLMQNMLQARQATRRKWFKVITLIWTFAVLKYLKLFMNARVETHLKL